MSRPVVLCLALLLVACGSPTGGTKIPCTVSNCGGCCDANGACMAGDTVSACGRVAAQCAVCTANQVCSSAGLCVLGSAGGSGGGSGSGGGAGGGAGGGGFTFDGGLDDCSEAAKLVYVVDQDKTLSSFDPRRVGNGNPFTDLGRLSCPAEFGAEPFSMSVDRNATAWIVYDSGELFTVNVKQTPLVCTKTTFMPQQNVAKFGMGFVSNAAGSKDETLFISGSPLTGSLTTTKFGTLSTTAPYTISLKGTLSGAPELTGTGDAKLWAFFPNVTPPRVSQLDKADGHALTSWNAPQLDGTPLAWAFAFWGGDFWIFLERTVDASTNVWRVNGQTGAVTNAVPDTNRRIVGAGVSTCAPVMIN